MKIPLADFVADILKPGTLQEFFEACLGKSCLTPEGMIDMTLLARDPSLSNEMTWQSAFVFKLIAEFGDQAKVVDLETARNYPNGRLGGDDQGEFSFIIQQCKKTNSITIRFSEPTTWIGFDAAGAAEVAQGMWRAAKNISDKPLSFEI